MAGVTLHSLSFVLLVTEYFSSSSTHLVSFSTPNLFLFTFPSSGNHRALDLARCTNQKTECWLDLGIQLGRLRRRGWKLEWRFEMNDEGWEGIKFALFGPSAIN